MPKIMVFVVKDEPLPHDPHEWHSRDGVITMGRPSMGFNMPSRITHRTLHDHPNIKFKELRDE